MGWSRNGTEMFNFRIFRGLTGTKLQLKEYRFQSTYRKKYKKAHYETTIMRKAEQEVAKKDYSKV